MAAEIKKSLLYISSIFKYSFEFTDGFTSMFFFCFNSVLMSNLPLESYNYSTHVISCVKPRICFQRTVLLFALVNTSYFKILETKSDSMKGLMCEG